MASCPYAILCVAMKITAAEFIKSVGRWEDLPSGGRAEVAFVGRSNVGKSSLINMLLHRKKLAHTSARPGKTRTLNYYLVNGRFYLVDLPGYGYAKAPRKERERWQQLIGRYLTERQPLQLIVHLIDSRHPPMEIDEEVFTLVSGQRVPYLAALTKADKLSGNKRQQSVRLVEEALRRHGLEAPIVPTSAKTGRGRGELLARINSLAGTANRGS